jgi:succinate-acetate transporter protein
MATTSETRTTPGLTNGNAAEFDRWRQSTRVFLQPIAAPSVLGLFGFAAATFMVATNLAGWYGNNMSGLYIFPFAATFGGIAQFAAGLWAYRARDAIATAMHGMWGTFWIAYGILWLLVAAGDLKLTSHGALTAFSYWFWPLAVITAIGAVAAVFENLGLCSVLATLATGSAFVGIGYVTGIHGWLQAGGWVLFASSVLAVYTAGAMMLKWAVGRTVLPLGEWRREANIPLEEPTHPIEYHFGEPGVKQGQ